MAEKYKEWNKKMLTFTIPSHIKGKTIKKGRYTKLRYLLEIRSYLSKCFNNTDGIKYFMNIELGKAYSNPHLHIQLWIDPMTSSIDFINLIYEKAIAKFNLNRDRCIITSPTHDMVMYHYVVKDYDKFLSDKELWDLEIQKKRMRKFLGKNVRFYSKSSDKYTQRVYKYFYKYFGVLRKYANEFIEKFVNIFLRRIPTVRVSWFIFSNLVIYRTRGFFFCIAFVILCMAFVFVVEYACRDPPYCSFLSHLTVFMF